MVCLMNQRRVLRTQPNIFEGALVKIVKGYKSLTIFTKKLHHRCLTWFKISLCEHNFTFTIFQKNIVHRKLMKFFCLKENKILSGFVYKSWNSPEGVQLYQKETPTHVFSCEYPRSFRYSFFIQNNSRGCFCIKFQYQKRISKKVIEEIACALISLFHVKILELASTSTATRAIVFPAKFAEFCHHKIFKTRSG